MESTFLKRRYKYRVPPSVLFLRDVRARASTGRYRKYIIGSVVAVYTMFGSLQEKMAFFTCSVEKIHHNLRSVNVQLGREKNDRKIHNLQLIIPTRSVHNRRQH